MAGAREREQARRGEGGGRKQREEQANERGGRGKDPRQQGIQEFRVYGKGLGLGKGREIRV